jgi:2-(1,2-epoxy-1,2-dihydrophenyl)acetyl-CoA isomerase
MTHYFHGAIARMTRMEAPVIIGINGTAGGGGFSLAITGDIIYSVKSAKFTVAYTNAGLSPDGSSTFFLPRIVGMKRAKELMLTNRIFSAEEALEMNLIDQVLDDQEQLDQAIEKQAEIFMKGPKRAYAGVKKLLNISFDNGLETQMDIEGIKISENAESLDGVEGLKAFSEKRKPNFNE